LFSRKNDYLSDAKKDLNNFSTDTQLVGDNYYINKTLIIFFTAQFSLTLAAIIYINWVICVAIIVSSLLPFIIPALLQKYVQKATDNFSKISAEYTDFINECLIGKMEIVSYGKENEVLERHLVLNKAVENARRKSKQTTYMSNVLSNSLGTLTFLTALGVGGYFVMIEQMTFGDMIAVVNLMNGLLSPVGALINALTEMNSVKGVRVVLDEKVSEDTYLKEELSGFNNSINVSNLSFSYGNPEDEENPVEPLFNNLDLTFIKGKKYALIGSSGAGKSTLAKILAGEITTYDGVVSIDGRDIKMLNLSEYKNIVRFLRQDPYIFNNTIINNVTFYTPIENEAQKDKLTQMINLTQIDEFIESEDDLNKEITNASGVSGGQKQRIALARTLYRGADVLILDEATSGIGSENTIEILSNIFKIFKDLTCIVISHQKDDAFFELFDEIVSL